MALVLSLTVTFFVATRGFFAVVAFLPNCVFLFTVLVLVGFTGLTDFLAFTRGLVDVEAEVDGFAWVVTCWFEGTVCAAGAEDVLTSLTDVEF